MKPIKHPLFNSQLNAPKGMEDNCDPLPCFRDGAQAISLWQMTWKERLQALWYGRIWLFVVGVNQPPVALTTNKEELRRA